MTIIGWINYNYDNKEVYTYIIKLLPYIRTSHAVHGRPTASAQPLSIRI